MKKLIKQWLRSKELQLVRYPADDLYRRRIIMRNLQIDTVLDVGANTGQYALKLREIGYQGRIVSFEPLQNAFASLQQAAQGDRNWTINHYALGDVQTNSVINVSGNSVSSSILNMLPAHAQSAPESKYVATEDIQIKTLDGVYSSFCTEQSRVMLKIDTQGYEKNVIDGATESLKRIKLVQLEMSMIPLYENEMLYIEMIAYLAARGLQLYSLEPGHYDASTGQLMQVDGVFVRT